MAALADLCAPTETVVVTQATVVGTKSAYTTLGPRPARLQRKENRR